jgi:hypothetical protein
MTRIIYDVANKSLSIDTATAQPWGADISAEINRYGQRINLTGVSLGATIWADDAEVLDMSLPPPGVTYYQTDQDVLAVARALWPAGAAIRIEAWCINNAGERIEASAEFVAPLPPQPFPSWTWTDDQWAAPIAYPDDDGEYTWDEEAGAWQEVEP